jgi:hypothetical protein
MARSEMRSAYAALAIIVGFSFAVGACSGSARTGGPPQQGPAEPLSPEVLAFLGPVATGAPFDGWHVAGVPHGQAGSVTLELEGQPGERFVVDVRARSADAPAGVAETSHLAVYVHSPVGAHTPDAAVRAATALAAALRAREDSGHAVPPLESLPAAPK